MKARSAIGIAALFLLCGFVFSLLILRPDPAMAVDAAEVNRIARSVEKHWGALSQADFSESPYDFSVTGGAGDVIYSTGGGAARSLWDAVGQGAAIVDISASGKPVGKVLVDTGIARRVRERDRKLSALTAAAFAACGLLTAGYFLYLRRLVFMPFQRLRDFAARVANGNLDVPLQMEHGNLFGAFTESFDMMRENLRRARAREFAVQQEKKELIASLSHDIRTPVTSIRLLCELMLVTAPAVMTGKLETIRAKADNIDALITNLFQATLEELGELRVIPGELASRDLAAMLTKADYLKRIEPPARIPDCLLCVDPLRMEQVLDNIISNSYKYADTRIEITAVLADEFLSLTVRDFGGGVEAGDLPRLTQKFFRGGNARDGGKEGAGLGLYLARYLMEKMGGDLTCRNANPGFAADLLIPLA